MVIEVEGALRSSVRHELESVGFIPTASKLYRPSPGTVPRSTLLEHVEARARDVVIVTAPAGYGKSTFLAEMAANDPRPAAWVSLTPGENDPASFLAYIALALDDIEPVDPGCVMTLWRVPPTIGSPTLQRFGAMLAARRQPFVLVLDDVHELVSREVVDVLPMLLAELPAGSMVMLGARTALPLPLGRLRVRRRLVELGAADLAFDESEATMLLRQLDVDADPHEIARLVERTEGWPVALYLAALAHGTRRGATLSDVVDDFAGDHRYLVDYLGEELLSRVDADVASFLMDASCFDRVSGSLCDDVLARRGSAQLLEELQRQNLLVIPLDDHREWYRFHHLLADFLQTELERRDPARSAAIHLRASEWCDAHGDGDGAVVHAVRGGDLDLAESMVVRWFPAIATAAQLYPNTVRWLAMFTDEQLGESPGADADRGVGHLLGGRAQRRPPVVGPRRRVAAGALIPTTPEVPSEPCRSPPRERSWPRSLPSRWQTRPRTPTSASASAMVTRRRASGEVPPPSCSARTQRRERWLREGADTALDRPLIVATCLAHLAAIDVEHGRWHEATTAARRARALLGDGDTYPTTVLVVAASALVEARAGRAAEADSDRQLARQHLTEPRRCRPMAEPPDARPPRAGSCSPWKPRRGSGAGGRGERDPRDHSWRRPGRRAAGRPAA